jgi:hypothetical protein
MEAESAYCRSGINPESVKRMFMTIILLTHVACFFVGNRNDYAALGQSYDCSVTIFFLPRDNFLPAIKQNLD